MNLKNLLDEGNAFEYQVPDENVLKNRYIETPSWSFSYGLSGISDSILKGLVRFAHDQEVFSRYKQLREGDIVNVSESSSVMHHALRNKSHEFYKTMTQDLYAALDSVENKTWVSRTNDPFHTLVYIGIGGSYLGPKLVYESLKNTVETQKKVFFVSNIDVQNAQSVLSKIDLDGTLFVCVSKSGSTHETSVNLTFIKNVLKEKVFKKKIFQTSFVALLQKIQCFQMCHVNVFYIFQNRLEGALVLPLLLERFY